MKRLDISDASGNEKVSCSRSAAHRFELHLVHLEPRTCRTGHWPGLAPLTSADLRDLMTRMLDKVDIDLIRSKIGAFGRDASSLAISLSEFCLDPIPRTKMV